MRHAKRRDANEPLVVAALEAVGAAVQRLEGDGLPDLLVSFRDRLFLLEVKNPDAKGGARYNTGGEWLTAAQRKWLARWSGVSPHVVQTVDEALRAIGART